MQPLKPTSQNRVILEAAGYPAIIRLPKAYQLAAFAGSSEGAENNNQVSSSSEWYPLRRQHRSSTICQVCTQAIGKQ